ncbi:chromate efflux transporter [Vibrio sp. SS-MA-C1-2]|uniref:chromate efflux transporter n=1 Tax=Vibrio sp. SS-MA-C1-2 TaxID=2908646 RepID=UPI001F406B4B|nr:chromate efflux transporter [Vibrio sp. SS-MA-C1-2]UJF17658.1 chromate efflux transporter [Vibrio sp. SS-MA-C1-2]
MFELFWPFFILGWISFGGPAAHIGYFRETFVVKKRWIEEQKFSQFVALSQILPGPGSSQIGFAIGYQRGKLIGGILAFLGFTLPSIIIMLSIALMSSQLTNSSIFISIVHSLKLLAVVVVADATWGMYKNFCRTKLTATLCIISAAILLLSPSVLTQVIVLIGALFIGYFCLSDRKKEQTLGFKKQPEYSILYLLLFFSLLLFIPFFASPEHPMLQLFSNFYQTGALVFGGGHVVLPLLQSQLGDAITNDLFLTGYAIAQAVPGPMFTLATYIGYHIIPDQPIIAALVSTLAIFLPGFLLLLSALKNWQKITNNTQITGALTGVNAMVVGFLLSALYQPVFNSAVLSTVDLIWVLFGALLMKRFNMPLAIVVLLFVVSGAVTGVIV